VSLVLVMGRPAYVTNTCCHSNHHHSIKAQLRDSNHRLQQLPAQSCLQTSSLLLLLVLLVRPPLLPACDTPDRPQRQGSAGIKATRVAHHVSMT
jgi:hypothetical protein